MQENYEIQKLIFSNNPFAQYIPQYLHINSNKKIFPYELKFIINNTENIEEECIITNLKSVFITILSGDTIIFTVPIEFFINLYGYIKTENKIKIPLEFKMFFGDITFITKEQNIFNIKLEYKPTFITESTIKIKICDCNKPIENNYRIMQQMQTVSIETNNQNQLNKQLIINNLTKGFFINANLDDVSNLKLLINGVLRLDYDEILLQVICKKFNDNLFYLPFNINQDYDDLSKISYEASLNFGRIDRITFEIYIKNIPKYVNIYFLSMNNVEYKNNNFILIYKTA
jgi:hypothetical protein